VLLGLKPDSEAPLRVRKGWHEALGALGELGEAEAAEGIAESADEETGTAGEDS
jgi:hypothetical protein